MKKKNYFLSILVLIMTFSLVTPIRAEVSTDFDFLEIEKNADIHENIDEKGEPYFEKESNQSILTDNASDNEEIVDTEDSSDDELIRNLTQIISLETSENWFECTACSEENPHMISSTADLDKIRTHLAKASDDALAITGYFKLANDIVFNDDEFAEEGAFYNNGWGWTPIGHNNKSSYFTGNRNDCYFDGNNFTIRNLKINRPSGYWYNGLFATIRSGVIKDITLDSFNIIADNSGTICGQVYTPLAGQPWAVVDNINIVNCTMQTILTAAKMSGLIIGCVSGTVSNITVDNCSLDGKLAWGGGFLFSETSNCQITNIQVTNSSAKVYAYYGLLAYYIGENSSFKDIVIRDCEVETTHFAWAYIAWEMKATKDKPAVLENIYCDVEFKRSNGNNESHYLIGNVKLTNLENTYSLNNSIFNVAFITNSTEESKTVLNNDSAPIPTNTIFRISYFDESNKHLIPFEETYWNTSMIRNRIFKGTISANDAYQFGANLPSQLNFSTSDTSIAGISDDGHVNVKKAGEVILMATTEIAGKEYIFASSTLTITPIEVTPTLNSLIGDTALTYAGVKQGLNAIVEDNEDVSFAYTYARRDGESGDNYGEPIVGKPSDAGYYRIVATATGKHSGNATAYLEIKPAGLSISAIRETSKYHDKNNKFENVKLVLDGIQGTDKITATATATVNSVDVGSYHSALLSDIVLNGTKKDNYLFSLPNGSVGVENGKSLSIINPSSPSRPDIEGSVSETGKKVKVEEVRTRKITKDLLGIENIIMSMKVKEAKEPIMVNIDIPRKYSEKKVYVVQLNPIGNILELVAVADVNKKGNIQFETASTEELTITSALPNGFISTIVESNTKPLTYFVMNNNEFKKGWLNTDSDDYVFFDYKTSILQTDKWVADGTDEQGNAKWYSLSANGKMHKSSWIASDSTGSKWYYVNENGLLLRNTMVDGYGINAEGYWYSE